MFLNPPVPYLPYTRNIPCHANTVSPCLFRPGACTSAIVGTVGILPRFCIFVPLNSLLEILGATIFIVYPGVWIHTVMSSYYWLVVYPPNLSCVVFVWVVNYV